MVFAKSKLRKRKNIFLPEFHQTIFYIITKTLLKGDKIEIGRNYVNLFWDLFYVLGITLAILRTAG